jgi:DNA-binding NtrC family response regulator
VTKTVLIVDDDEATAWALAATLREEGFLTRVVHSAQAALFEQAAHPADLVITDVRLPDRSGFELIAELEVSEPAPLIIVISAWGGEEIHRSVARAGALAYLSKPFDLDRLKQLVVGALAAPVPPGRTHV